MQVELASVRDRLILDTTQAVLYDVLQLIQEKIPWEKANYVKRVLES